VNQRVSKKPDQVPQVGQILTLKPEDWRYHDGNRKLVVQVAGVRDDLSNYYDGKWVWIEGWEVELLRAQPDGQEPPGHRMQVLVRCGAIPQVEPGNPGPPQE